jgi:predicted permease
MDANNTDSRLLFFTPAGAAIAFLSFFLPWIQISCLGRSSYSGMDFGGIYWLVLLMAAVILGAFFLLRKLRRMDLLKTVTVGATIVACGVIVYGCFAIAGGKRILFVRLGPDDVNLRLHLGGYGTFLGYFLALVGVTARRRRHSQPTQPTSSTKASQSQNVEH